MFIYEVFKVQLQINTLFIWNVSQIFILTLYSYTYLLTFQRLTKTFDPNASCTHKMMLTVIKNYKLKRHTIHLHLVTEEACHPKITWSVKFFHSPVRYGVIKGSDGRNSFTKPNTQRRMDSFSQISITVDLKLRFRRL